MKNFRKTLIPAVLLLELLFSSCSFRLLPPYDREIAAQIEMISKMTDRFYLEMLEKTENAAGGRSFTLFRDRYINIEIELNSLYQKNRVRPQNNNSLRVIEIALKKWNDYKEMHKRENSISDGIIRMNRKYLSDLFYTMQVAEEAKK